MSGWAWHREPQKTYGSFITDMEPAGGVAAQDMPVRRPGPRPRARIKGVPAPGGSDPDYAPGQGTWRPVTREG
jgi:hypothetical protein